MEILCHFYIFIIYDIKISQINRLLTINNKNIHTHYLTSRFYILSPNETTLFLNT